jgi:hypothetical protein
LAALADRLVAGDDQAGENLRGLEGRVRDGIGGPRGVPMEECVDRRAHAEWVADPTNPRLDPLSEIFHSPLGREAWSAGSVRSLRKSGQLDTYAQALHDAARRWAAHEIVGVRLPIPGRHYSTD